MGYTFRPSIFALRNIAKRALDRGDRMKAWENLMWMSAIVHHVSANGSEDQREVKISRDPEFQISLFSDLATLQAELFKPVKKDLAKTHIKLSDLATLAVPRITNLRCVLAEAFENKDLNRAEGMLLYCLGRGNTLDSSIAQMIKEWIMDGRDMSPFVDIISKSPKNLHPSAYHILLKTCDATKQ